MSTAQQEMDCRTEETGLELCYYFIISSSQPMVKQADHNSPLLKGQSGWEGQGGVLKNLYFYNFTDAGGSFDFWTNLQWFLLQS